ncbi:hypothetical protein PSYPI_36355, partial [Pseudomonas syringae pv. pisi str. 1704B]
EEEVGALYAGMDLRKDY